MHIITYMQLLSQFYKIDFDGGKEMSHEAEGNTVTVLN